jgi:F-type H+-transporting ATPase subunit delta
VKLTTAVPVSEELKKSIMDKISADRHLKSIELVTAVDESLIGGFVLEVGDELVDGSIAFDLKNIKKQFQNNDFIYKIR